MPNRWITFVKKWSSENNVSYGCALTKPEMKAEYHKLYPKVVKTKGVAKLEESRPPADVKSKVTYPNLSIRIPTQQENIQFEIEEMDEQPPKSKKGRPAKYMTEDEKYKAKLESNKQKRREKAAAKKNKLSEKERIDEEERDARQKKQIIKDKMYPIAEKLIEDLKFKINFGYNNTKDQKVSKLVSWIRNRNIWELPTEKQRDEYRELERLIELEEAIPYRHSWKETQGGMMKAPDTLQLTKKDASSTAPQAPQDIINDRIPTNPIVGRLMTEKEKAEMIKANKEKKGKAYTTTQDLMTDPLPTDRIEIARLKRIANRKQK
jgi:hypothetical protein